MKFRKKPVVIEAERLTRLNAERLAAKIRDGGYVSFVRDGKLYIQTLESNQITGTLAAEIGDWIIRGVKGEFYPCKPDIFAETYEPAGEP